MAGRSKDLQHKEAQFSLRLNTQVRNTDVQIEKLQQV